MEFSLLTLNLNTYQQHPLWSHWDILQAHEREVHIISEAVVHLGIDVICFQEVGEHMHGIITYPYGRSGSNMAFRIFKRLHGWGRHYHLHQDWSHIGFGQWREGTAILSRYPMCHNYSTYVSSNRRKDDFMSRNVTVTCINLPFFGLLHVANVHINWLAHGFIEEFENLKHLANSRRHFGVRAEILCGDFNAPAEEGAYNHVVGRAEYVDQFYELHPHRFFEPSFRGNIRGWENIPPKRIDYIFKQNGCPIRVKTMDVIFNDSFYPAVSDHFGYLARFQLY